jgi:hypothetical protein
MYLPGSDIKGAEQAYVVVLEQKNKQNVQAEFKIPAGQDLLLEYTVEVDKLRLKTAPVVSQPNVSQLNNSKPAVTQASGAKLADKSMRGKIYLQVQSRGEAWYINPADGLRYYLGGAKEAYDLMRRLGTGITNRDLNKIEPLIDTNSGTDTDNDGLPDKLEKALGTEASVPDTDNDGFDDYQEVINGFNPLGKGVWSYDRAFAVKQAGKILLQVDSLGEAWYVNPTNLKRYYLSNGEDAYRLMRQLGQGISNANLEKIAVGK